MIFMDNIGLGKLFDYQAEQASRLARSANDTVVLFWNCEALEVTPGMTPAQVDAAWRKLDSELAELRNRPALDLMKQKGEDDESLVRRGIATSECTKTEVTLVFSSRHSMQVQPWTKFEVAMYFRTKWRSG